MTTPGAGDASKGKAGTDLTGWGHGRASASWEKQECLLGTSWQGIAIAQYVSPPSKKSISEHLGSTPFGGFTVDTTASKLYTASVKRKIIQTLVAFMVSLSPP